MRAHRRGLTLTLAIASGLGWSALARATVSEGVRLPPLPTVAIEGAARGHDARVEIRCHGTEPMACDVHIQLELEAGARGVWVRRAVPSDIARPSVGLTGEAEILIDGRPVVAAMFVDPHRRVRLEVRYAIRPIHLEWRSPATDLFLRPPRPIDVRHLVLGEGWRLSVWPLEGNLLHIQRDVVTVGGVRFEASMPPGIEVIVDGERLAPGAHQLARLPGRVLARNPTEAPPLVHGGPVLTLGGLIRTDNAPTRFILGFGYELGFADYFILSAWVETDFESIQEAVMVEVASQAYGVLPSVAAGVGVVSTQLGDRDVDVGLRMRATIDFYVAGFIADFDYFFLSGGWNITLAARFSL